MIFFYQAEHKILLRPTLGHPHNRNQLQSLCESEENRKKDYINGVETNSQNLKVETLPQLPFLFYQFTSGLLYFSGPPCGIIFSENLRKKFYPLIICCCQ